MYSLNEMQQDALTEIINIGMGSAAAALSVMVSDEIRLSVPQVSFIPDSEIGQHFSDLNIAKLAGVRQGFSGGDAILIFPSDQSIDIVRLLLASSLPMGTEEFSSFEQEALSELGNIILNAGISAIANTLKFSIESSLPIYKQGDLNMMIPGTNKDQAIMLLRVDLEMEQRQVKGYVIYLMDISSVDLLIQHIDMYIASIPT